MPAPEGRFRAEVRPAAATSLTAVIYIIVPGSKIVESEAREMLTNRGQIRRHFNSLTLGGPSIVLLTGMAKGFRTVFSNADYAKVRRLGDEYLSRKPRSVER
jgi:hypothetical protein